MPNSTTSPLPSSDGEILIEPFKFTNDYDGFYLLLSKLAPLDQHSIIIGLESTAHYGDNLVRFLITKDFKVCVLNPLSTSAMRKNNVRKTKTDKVDTFVIAKTLMMQDSLRFFTLEDLDYIELKELGRFRQKLVKYEEISDRIEYEIAQFLNALSEDSISEETRTETKRMYKIIGELESLGDSGESISRILSRRNSRGKIFSDEQKAKIETMLVAVDKAYGIMIDNLRAKHFEPLGLRMATDCEIEINDLRNSIREEEIRKIETDGSNYQSSVYYLDTVSEIERMGDFIINISQALDK